jgi:hypothetical protein
LYYKVVDPSSMLLNGISSGFSERPPFGSAPFCAHGEHELQVF